MANIPQLFGQLGLAQLGGAQLGQYFPESNLAGSATIVGQGVLTANGVVLEFGSVSIVGQGVETAAGGVIVLTSVSIVGQGVLTAAGSILVLGSVTMTGQGLFVDFLACPRDATVILYLLPRATIAVVMPTAYVTSVNALNNTLTCGVNQDTIPVTGSLNSLVELSSVPQNNQ